MRKLVKKIENGEDPSSVYATTYQMRNFYRQFADGFFSSLDVMNYIQHFRAVKMMRKGDRVLDVCCGRGLLLPLIRYHARDISEYVGIDISKTNMKEQERLSGVKKISGLDYYPFKISHIVTSCEDMGDFLEKDSFDFIVYSSSIEHMQKKTGLKSLQVCFSLLKSGKNMFISCPNTRNKKDPYDTQYAAHLYEWNLQELQEELTKIGFLIQDVFGLVAKVKEFELFMKTQSKQEQKMYARLKQYLPSPWLMSFLPVLYPQAASEILIIASKKKNKGFQI